jgi:arylsulfatase A-like enzyme
LSPAVAILLALCFCAITRGHAAPPNFVLIFADDLGYGDLGCYGSKNPTPNLDRMAAEGVRFTQFYVAQAVCSASRSALLTGCYANRVSIQGALPPRSKTALHHNEITIAELLKTRGYATGMYGKWHLGDHPDYLPPRQGFDDYLGLPYSNDMWPFHPSGAQRTNYPLLPLIKGTNVLEFMPDQTKLTRTYTDHAVDFIRKNKENPFFLYVAHAMPHVPLYNSAKHRGKSGQGTYGDTIMEIDWSVGEILKALKRHGVEENTFVVFTSDNGPWLVYGNHAGTAGHLREGKGTVFEGGVRVPCIMRWPGKIPAGDVCNELAVTFDLFPTFAKLAGATVPNDRVIDGKDIWPLLIGGKTPHEVFYYYWAQHLQAVRWGKWKLHLPHSYPHPEPVGKEGRPGTVRNKQIGAALFDLEQDPGEMNDLYAQQSSVVNLIERLAEKAREDLGDSATKRIGKNVRPAADVNPVPLSLEPSLVPPPGPARRPLR